MRYFVKEVELNLPSEVWEVQDRLRPTLFMGRPLVDDTDGGDGRPFCEGVCFSYSKVHAEAICALLNAHSAQDSV